MFEELNLQDEHLVPTSHPKIRSYVCHQDLDAMQIKASLQRLQAIVEGHDVANLVLLLKELVPDYNPGTELLKTALSIQPYNARSRQDSCSSSADRDPGCGQANAGLPIELARSKSSLLPNRDQGPAWMSQS